MASVVFTGYVGLGTAISNAGVITEVSGGSYARKALSLTGSAVAGLTQSITQFSAATTPANATIYYGMIFDASSGGNMLAYWTWTTSGASTTAFPAQTVNIQFSSVVAASLNLALQGGSGAFNSLIDQGAQIGTVNGLPMTAGCRLLVQNGGNLIAHLGKGTITSAMDILDGLYVGGKIRASAADLLTATASGTQTTALLLAADRNRITTVATAADAVKLPPSEPGLAITVENSAANAMQVFSSGSDTINGIAGATGISQIPGSIATYVCFSSGAWQANGYNTALPSGGSIPTGSATTGITAHSGGGQGSAVALTSYINEVSTVGAGGDSVVLPASVAGMSLIVKNSAASNSMNVFPASGDKINALSANSAFAMAAAARIMFFCAAAGQWWTLPLVAS